MNYNTFSSFKELFRWSAIDDSGDKKTAEGLCLSKAEKVSTDPCLGAQAGEEAESKSS